MESAQGIREAVQREGVLTRKRFEAIRRHLRDQVILPTLSFKGAGFVTYGERLMIPVQGLPLPTLDLYENKLVKSDSDGIPHKLFAIFTGIEGPIVVPVEYQPKASELHLMVPKHAVDGTVTIRFLVKEHLGSASLLEKLDPGDDAFQTRLKKSNPNRPVPPHCQCEAPLRDETKGEALPPQPCRPREPDYEEMPDQMVLNEFWIDTSMRLYVRCFDPEELESWETQGMNCCPICPYGAIKVDANGNCRVNPQLCRGQSYKTRRGEDSEGESTVERTGEESVCWDCFNPGDGLISTKCYQRRLQKSTHIDSTNCCGDCPSCSRRLDDLDVSEVCPVHAIWMNDYPERFVVVEDACIGCMVCIDNIDCWLNTNAEPQERTLKMVAYLPSWVLPFGKAPPWR